MAKSTSYKLYCAVYACLNTTATHPEKTFFKLPANSVSRLQWLKVIRRSDLETKTNFGSYRVCENHFKEEDIQQSQKRKLLKKFVVPSLMLPSFPEDYKKEKQTQTDPSIGVENSSETESESESAVRSPQTSTNLSSNTPRKRKLSSELQSRKKTKQQENETREDEENFHNLCDKFLSKELALIIKAQSKIEQGKEKQYDQDYISYCLNLYRISPQAYRFLQSALCLPCPLTLLKQSIPNPNHK